MVMRPAPKPSRPPALRRPISSEKNENDSRPMKPNTESRIIILEASCGVTFNNTTNSAGAQEDEQGGQSADRKQEPPVAAADQRAHHRAEPDAERDYTGHETTDPAPFGGGHELLHQWQIHAIEPADAQADKEAHDREIDPAMVRREI